MKTNVVVVAHPDDEIIFASSIIRSSRSVVICFSEIPEDMRVDIDLLLIKAEEYFLKNINHPKAIKTEIKMYGPKTLFFGSIN